MISIMVMRLGIDWFCMRPEVCTSVNLLMDIQKWHDIDNYKLLDHDV